MKLRKQLWSLARLTLPVLGFGVTSCAVYLASLQNPYYQPSHVLPAYGMMALGFGTMISGVFWSVCHSMRSEMYQRGSPRPPVHIFTIDRPNTFPPSYEESEGNPHTLVMAPPLYSLDGSEAPDCRWSWEHPPRYSQVEPRPAS